ncbi:interferon alpha-inducible protein 27-like protein 2A isoform X1 [Dermochelys coriacea]|uniref:interferon alpha-inducible protein 27-like protein 2A isoform X1 n=1 Tax=Dermochelys coriacea TaxID=27794 RepID=UPI0018E80955|nr:interferon alpha-inducible protein 27-like protein 2A isoform X1 [Dermochelys coriacea]
MFLLDWSIPKSLPSCSAILTLGYIGLRLFMASLALAVASGPVRCCFTETGNPSDSLVTLVGAGIGAGVAVVGIPVVVGAVGFTGAGIAAGSIAAKMMSAAAIANGGGVAAGSAVATLQSIAAAGLPVAAKAAIVGVGAAVSALF